MYKYIINGESKKLVYLVSLGYQKKKRYFFEAESPLQLR